jgi:hypothetical protein
MKFEVSQKEQLNSEKYQEEALIIAQRISQQWKNLKEKVDANPNAIHHPKLLEIYEMNKPPQTGIQLWFEYQLEFIKNATGNENTKSRMMYHLKEDLETIEEMFKDELSK